MNAKGFDDTRASFMLEEKNKGTHSSKILKEILATIIKRGVYYINIYIAQFANQKNKIT